MKSEVEVKLKHVALCSNKSTNCFDVGPTASDQPLTFGSSNSVVVYKVGSSSENEANTFHSAKTFNFHNHQVVSLQWVRFHTQKQIYKDEILVSGDEDGVLVVSKLQTDSKDSFVLKVLQKYSSHDAPINCIDGMKFTSNNDLFTLVASSGADSKVNIYFSFSDFQQCIPEQEPQVLKFGNRFVLGLRFHLLSSNTPILACACDDFKIRLYVGQKQAGETSFYFVESVTLEGHEDWVRSLSFTNLDTSCLFASTSQDYTVRVWKIEEEKAKSASTESSLMPLEVKKKTFQVESPSREKITYSVYIETVLEGHENWVYSAEWNVRDGESKQKLQLLTASLDKTIIVWEYDEDDKMWVDTVRVGEVGGNTLGFYKAMFHRNNRCIVAQSYSGALYYWKLDENDRWQVDVVTSGHMAPVLDIDWEANGRFLVSTSKDQTTRLYAEWKHSTHSTWHEMARPQIHGFDMQCVAMLNNHHFVSGGDEKVVRVFQPPKNFLENFETLTGQILSENVEDAPQGASVPALGLSNKAIFGNETQPELKENYKNRNDQYIDNKFQSLVLNQPPSETDLLQNTLWPEVSKLYGHVYEIYAAASNSSGSLFATASISAKEQHAGIYVWQTHSWENVGVVQGHKLTVTQIEFSPDENYILSVSRDRKWSLHSVKCNDGKFAFELVAQSDKKSGHARIIWSCSWASDSKSFITGSRDKKVMFWSIDEKQNVSRRAVMDCGVAVTAVAFSHHKVLNAPDDVFAVGLENGTIKICAAEHDADGVGLIELFKFDVNISHSLAVQRLKWRPQKEDNESLHLASCALDHQVKVFELKFV